ncbi:superoxide dismutase family protein [Marinoscillum furvescens]|uniref:Cu-Zn family superoxide dismutase n=1 Tax=Marinoscillum furvescens DSM 4134 TaxID=1122208 RepID=A0A3D9LJE2_MARFU|nr:superoxide dismutase family protein [Marinoscillum furvescens]REE05776.1 Cu-Zn family superoxide dismutase [Marinoscillum furvescens DSM 4134]
MMKTNWLIVLLILLVVACDDEAPTKEPDEPALPTAIAPLSGMLQNNDGSYVLDTNDFGSAVFIQKDSFVLASISLKNFAPNTVHAIHLHAGTCENPGMHWNQGKDMSHSFCNEKSLGITWGKPMAGDVGNASVGYDGTGSLEIKTDLWEVGTGSEKDITGAVLVIHETFEDFTTECDPNHGAHPHDNAKIACGTLSPVTQ